MRLDRVPQRIRCLSVGSDQPHLRSPGSAPATVAPAGREAGGGGRALGCHSTDPNRGARLCSSQARQLSARSTSQSMPQVCRWSSSPLGSRGLCAVPEGVGPNPVAGPVGLPCTRPGAVAADRAYLLDRSTAPTWAHVESPAVIPEKMDLATNRIEQGSADGRPVTLDPHWHKQRKHRGTLLPEDQNLVWVWPLAKTSSTQTMKSHSDSGDRSCGCSGSPQRHDLNFKLLLGPV